MGQTEVATFAAGCFWCVEAVLQQLAGVQQVVSGYMGGEVDNPTYEMICTGTTGHVEVLNVELDPTQSTTELMEDLIKFFFMYFLIAFDDIEDLSNFGFLGDVDGVFSMEGLRKHPNKHVWSF